MKRKQCLSHCFFKIVTLILKNCYFIRHKSWRRHFHVNTYIITVCIEFIKVLKWINNCELISAAKVIPQHQALILKDASELYYCWSMKNKFSSTCTKWIFNCHYLGKQKLQFISLLYFNLYSLSLNAWKKIDFKIVN